MYKYKIKIKKIIIINNIYTIESYDNKIFISKIKNGSVNFNIYNNLSNEIFLNNIEENDIIKIYGYPKYNSKEKNIINNILIKKIIINKYNFISSESSDDEYIFS
jgi:hypothetical protein